MKLPINPYLRLPDNPNYLRRAKHHDYRRPGQYLLTLSKAETTPMLSHISGSIAEPVVDLTPAGQCVVSAIEQWPERYSQIRVANYVVMPDHVHLCVDVMHDIDNTLGRAVGSMMGIATKLHGGDLPFYNTGFNDRITYDNEQWKRQQAYVADNPRRFLIKQGNPDLFYARWIITVDGFEYMAVGNIMLLKNPDLQVVRFSRRYATGVFEDKVKGWRRCVEDNGVLVSPFIHPNERAVSEDATAQGAGIIRICENCFAERFTPQGHDFNLMTNGQLLLIGALEHNTRPQPLTYIKAQSLNAVAERIAAAPWLTGHARIRRVK